MAIDPESTPSQSTRGNGDAQPTEPSPPSASGRRQVHDVLMLVALAGCLLGVALATAGGSRASAVDMDRQNLSVGGWDTYNEFAEASGVPTRPSIAQECIGAADEVGCTALVRVAEEQELDREATTAERMLQLGILLALIGGAAFIVLFRVPR